MRCEVAQCGGDAPYRCPRCDARYCSVACYATHSARCVAAFARAADEPLRGVRVGDVQRAEANATLLGAMRQLALDDEDGDERHDAAEQLRELLADLEAGASYEEGLARLPGALAADFRAALRDGRALRAHRVWVPWWMEDGADGAVPPPPGKGDLAVTVSAARARGAAALRYSLVDVVGAYCHALRVYDGDGAADAKGVARLLVRRSGALGVDARHGGVCEALSGRANEDVAAVYGGGRGWVCRALAHAARLLHGGGQRTKARKVRFLVAWAQGEDEEAVRQVLREMASCAAGSEEERMLSVAKRCAAAGR